MHMARVCPPNEANNHHNKLKMRKGGAQAIRAAYLSNYAKSGMYDA